MRLFAKICFDTTLVHLWTCFLMPELFTNQNFVTNKKHFSEISQVLDVKKKTKLNKRADKVSRDTFIDLQKP